MKLFSKSFDLKTGVAGERKQGVAARRAAHRPKPGRQSTREIPRRPALRLPFPHACAKGRRTLSRAGQAGLRRSSWHLRCHQGTPGEGSLRKAFRRKPFLPSCACRRQLRPQGLCPRTPTTFEKVDETFTRLRRRFYKWLIILARYPAPKPLSMFTTLTPLAQEFSIDSRAARPPKAAP